MRATINVVPTLRDFWLDIDYAEDRTSQNRNPNAREGPLGMGRRGAEVHRLLDRQQRRHQQPGVGRLRRRHDVWRGTERIGGAALATRDTFVKKSASKIVHTGEAFIGGAWQALSEETCKKFHFF